VRVCDAPCGGSEIWHTLLTSGDQARPASCMIAAVSLRMLYLIFQQVFGLVLF
jgi:hypothetical protein